MGWWETRSVFDIGLHNTHSKSRVGKALDKPLPDPPQKQGTDAETQDKPLRLSKWLTQTSSCTTRSLEAETVPLSRQSRLISFHRPMLRMPELLSDLGLRRDEEVAPEAMLSQCCPRRAWQRRHLARLCH